MQMKTMSKKIIVVAGGAGFLGSHLCKYYVDRGNKVICIDNLSTGRKSNIEQLLKSRLFTFIESDICISLPESVTKQDIDIVVNLASPASPPKYQELAVETLMTGSNGTKNLLDLAVKNKARFFHASTSEVYGDPTVHPQPESYRGNVNCYGPRSMYDEAKRFAEALIYVYREKYELSTVIARFFNTYGPHMDPTDGRVVSNFIVQALKDEPLTVYGDGQQTRSFCYVDDLIEGIDKCINSALEGPINLGNPKEFTIMDLAELVEKMIPNKKLNIVHKKLPGDDPMQRRPDIKMAQKLLDWQPQVSLENGLKPTIEYFKKII